MGTGRLPTPPPAGSPEASGWARRNAGQEPIHRSRLPQQAKPTSCTASSLPTSSPENPKPRVAPAACQCPCGKGGGGGPSLEGLPRGEGEGEGAAFQRPPGSFEGPMAAGRACDLASWDGWMIASEKWGGQLPPLASPPQLPGGGGSAELAKRIHFIRPQEQAPGGFGLACQLDASPGRSPPPSRPPQDSSSGFPLRRRRSSAGRPSEAPPGRFPCPDWSGREPWPPASPWRESRWQGAELASKRAAPGAFPRSRPGKRPEGGPLGRGREDTGARRFSPARERGGL